MRPPIALAFGAWVFAGCTGLRDAWRDWPPEAAETVAWTVPVFRATRLENGLTVIVVEDRDFPRTAVGVAFKAGTLADPPGREGLASLTLGALVEAGKKSDGRLPAAAAEELGGQSFGHVGNSGSMLGLVVDDANTESAAELLAELVIRPAFDDGSFGRLRESHLAALRRRQLDPEAVAHDRMLAAAFGEDHPFARPAGGSLASASNIGLADAIGFHRAYVAPNAAALIFAGPVDLSRGRTIAAISFGSWRGAAGLPRGFVPPAPVERSGILLVHARGLRQALMLMGRSGVRAGDPDEPGIVLGSYVLSQLLHVQLREIKGYTYGAGADAWFGPSTGLISVGSYVRTDAAGSAIKDALTVVKRLWRGYRYAEVHELSKKSVLRSTVNWFDTAYDRAGAAASLFWGDQPMSAYESLIEDIAAADHERVASVIERYFNPAMMHVVVAGNADLLRPQLDGMSLYNP